MSGGLNPDLLIKRAVRDTIDGLIFSIVGKHFPELAKEVAEAKDGIACLDKHLGTNFKETDGGLSSDVIYKICVAIYKKLESPQKHPHSDLAMNHHHKNNLILEELRKIMSTFLDNIEANIAKIHIEAGIDNATVVKEISDAVTAGVTPLQTQITDLQTALNDTVTVLVAQNTTIPASASAIILNTSVIGSNATDTVSGATGNDISTGESIASSAPIATVAATDTFNGGVAVDEAVTGAAV